ncbi:MAG: dihydrodipicolinate reductase [Acidimicrobiales bacterium]
MTTPQRPLRVVQWGSGNVGRHALRAVLARTDLELVGCYVTNPAKAGRDVGELLDRPAVGVRCTDRISDVLEADADCVLHMPLPSKQVADDPELDTTHLCALLASGKNVITTVGYVYPKAYGTDVLARLQDACTVGRVSLHGTGVNPGFMADLVPLVLSGLCERVDRVHVREASEFSRYPSPEIILGMMGFGKTPAEYNAHTGRYRRWLSGLFEESVHLVADGLAMPIDRVAVDEEVLLAEVDLQLAAGPVPEGTVAGQRWVWSGMVGDTTVVELEAIYRAHPTVGAHWAGSGWYTRIDGRPPITLELERWLGNGLLGTAMHAVNAVPAVCAAPAGIRTFLDLPVILGRWGGRHRS